jgi:hypothetical protein
MLAVSGHQLAGLLIQHDFHIARLQKGEQPMQ